MDKEINWVFFLLIRSVLTVACEQTEVLLFDPISSRHIKTLTEAHEDCVNNIRCIILILNLWGKVLQIGSVAQ